MARRRGAPSLDVIARRIRFCVLVGVFGVGVGAAPAAAATFPVTTVAESGAGSLRAAITAANLTAGHDAITFAIAGAGPFAIDLATPLPEITDGAGTTIDATTQPGYDAQPLLGTGGTVGVDAVGLPRVRRPLVELIAPTSFESVLRIRGAGNSVVRGLQVVGGQFAIFVLESAHVTIEDNLVGATAAFSDPGAMRSVTGIRFRTNSTGAVVRENLVGFSAGLDCVRFEDGSGGALVEGNEIAGCGTPLTPADDAVTLEFSDGATVRANLLRANGGQGVDALGGVSATTIENNTIRGNGRQGNELAGVRLSDENGAPTADATVRRNVISGNVGAGVLVTGNAAGSNARNTISENSIFGNAIGIDLVAPVADKDVGDGVTLDDPGDGDQGGNALLNFPVIDTALSGSLTVTGWAPAGATLEFFTSDPAPGGFGQGRTFIAGRVEGSPDDLDDSVSGFGPGPVNGVLQGADTTNRFRFVLPGVAVAPGSAITATATLAGDTSEFSGLASVAAARADLALSKSAPATVARAQTLTYTIAVTNHGPDDADNVTVADPTPPGLRLIATGGACASAFPCALGLLAVGATRTITAQYAVPADYSGPSPIVNSATVTSSAVDDVPANNTASASTIVEAPVPSPPVGGAPPPPAGPAAPATASLSLTKIAQRHRVRAGSRVGFTIRIANRGTATASDIRVCDRLPRGLFFVSAPGARVRNRQACWTIGRLSRRARRTFHVRAGTELLARRTRLTNLAIAHARNVADPTTRARARILILPVRDHGCPAHLAHAATQTPGNRRARPRSNPIARAAC